MRQYPSVGGQNSNGGHLGVGLLKGLEFRKNLGHQSIMVVVAAVAAIIFQHAAQTGKAGFLGQGGMHHVQQALQFPSLTFDGKGHFLLYKPAHVLFCNIEADTCKKQKNQYAGDQNTEQHFLKDAKLHGDSSLLDTPVLFQPFFYRSKIGLFPANFKGLQKRQIRIFWYHRYDERRKGYASSATRRIPSRRASRPRMSCPPAFSSRASQLPLSSSA